MVKKNRPFGAFIAQCRINNGMERKDLARKATISYNYLSSIENGYDTPSDPVMTRIAKALRIPKNELYFKANRVSPEIVQLIINDSETRKIVLDKLYLMIGEQHA